jgi:hypothetical protein
VWLGDFTVTTQMRIGNHLTPVMGVVGKTKINHFVERLDDIGKQHIESMTVIRFAS